MQDIVSERPGDQVASVPSETQAYVAAMEHLVLVVQELSLARDLPAITAIVRRAARELTGADGATFVLRDKDLCHYADEDAIAPLWKGQRFPMRMCVSGWVMLNAQEVIIPDIYADPRVPADAYRPTFVKSLAMVPIRRLDPLGAIGNYWARQYRPTQTQIKVLQALADTTAVAMENVQVYEELEQRVKERTLALEEANKELEAFTYGVSHDLRAPLRGINGFAEVLREECSAGLGAKGLQYLTRIQDSGRRMGQLIEDLLTLAKTAERQVRLSDVDLAALARDVLAQLRMADPARAVAVTVAEPLRVKADPGLIRVVLENLLSNAWKYTGKRPQPSIDVGVTATESGERAYYVRDNGAGFDMAYASRLFEVFQRMHSDADFPGTGVGLATVKRVIRKHGGRVWAEAQEGHGATFFFTLP